MRYPPLKRIRHVLEWGALQLLVASLSRIGLRRASGWMGAFARRIGPLVRRKHNIARRNLRRAFPDWSEAQVEQTLRDMWENMGRYVGELPYIASMSADDFRAIAEIRGEEHLLAAKSCDGSLFFSAHMANWELGAKASWACGVPFAIVYRPLNNPLTDRMASNYRDRYQLRGLPKTAVGSRELLKTLRDGDPVAILIDQKMNTGVPIPFFGHEAMTSPAIADLAVKYGHPIIPTRVERLGHEPKFRITFEPPVHWEPTGDAKADAITIMEKLHGIMEGWIREHPGHWFWVHKRWG